MKSIDFINGIREAVVEENLEIYKDLFENTNIESATDRYWKEALLFFSKLDSTDKNIFFRILRQIEVDTTSNILSILDGVSWLEGQEDEFKLTTKNSNDIINGELQDKFLELEENS